MHYGKFQTYNIVGAVTWVSLFIWGGYLVGNIPIIRDNFGIVTIAVIVVSLVPFAMMLLKRKPVAG
jgi:membrane-associated protein